MGRPRSFDEDEVLARALEVFHAQGYAATSIADLEAAMGIKAGSIYKAFTDKRTLFMRAVDLYLKQGRKMTADAMQGATPREAIRRWLYAVADMATETPSRGCFAVNCAVELGAQDSEIRRRLKNHDRQLTRLFTELIIEAQEQGQLRDGDPARYALQLRIFINGLQVEGKKGLANSEAKGLVDQLLDTLAA